MDLDLRLASEFAEAHPAEAASLLERWPARQAADFLAAAAPRTSAAAIAHMLPAAAAERLELMTVDAACAIFAELPADVAGRVLRLSSSELRGRFIDTLAPDIAGPVRRILEYPEGTAGALANPFVLTVPRDASVDRARRRLRSRGSLELYVYVLGRDHSLAGVVDVRDLLHASARDAIDTIMAPQVARVIADTGIAELDAHPGWREWDALPVVERSGAFVGAIKHKTLRRLSGPDIDPAGMQPLVQVLVALGELYWLGLSSLLESLTAHRPRNFTPGER